ncbi:14-3-3-like protein [Cornus florida]|uniref:14-3-3-like protein n=1 Tax=Cornus florida TaxID=4283 RepID=UPI00289D0F87|nr:14-3-3-like protein [Cornus florida]
MAATSTHRYHLPSAMIAATISLHPPPQPLPPSLSTHLDVRVYGKDFDGGELVKERYLLSVAYKNVIDARGEPLQRDHISMIRNYISKVKSQLSSICDDILKLFDLGIFLQLHWDSIVFHLKIESDYHHYVADFKAGLELKEATESILNAYKSI